MPFEPVSVSLLNEYIKRLVAKDEGLQAVCVVGEISNFTAHRSGHMYFSLKDEQSLIRAVMFRSDASTLRFSPETGMRVVIFGHVSVYTRDGQYQLYVSHMEPDGIGALALQFQRLKARLEAEGLFSEERKRPLPPYPRRIGVITSPTGAAVRDILSILNRRYPDAEVLLYPVSVQGAEAPASLTAAVQAFSLRKDLDVVIIGRGGGAPEDLFAFNDEALVRAIAACAVPIVSAVGHETDFTLSDFAADLRAPTPSAAAELVVPDRAELAMRTAALSGRLLRAVRAKLDRAAGRLALLTSSRRLLHPETIYDDYKYRLLQLQERLDEGICDVLENAEETLARQAAKLEAMSPLAVLSRGYAAVMRGEGEAETAVCRAALLAEADEARLLFSDGFAKAKILSVTLSAEKEEDPQGGRR